MNTIEAKYETQHGELLFTSRIKRTIASIFRNPYETLQEFTDNSVNYRNKDGGQPTKVNIIITNDKIEVTDYGGLGANADGIRLFTRAGDTAFVGVSQGGLGAKAAAFYLGTDLYIHSKKAGEDIEYAAAIIDFGNENLDYRGTYEIQAQPSRWDMAVGRFEIGMKRLKVSQSDIHGSVLRKRLGETYRPLLFNSATDITDGTTSPTTQPGSRLILDADGNFKEERDGIQIFVTTQKKRREPVVPLEIPLLPEYSEQDIQVIETANGEKMWYWAGEMGQKDPRYKLVDPAGIRFYYEGRLMTIDYCGFDSRDLRLKGLVGEAHLDHIQEIKGRFSVNKSAGLDTSGEQWNRVTTVMNQALTPFIEQLQTRRATAPEERSREMDQIFKDVRQIMDMVLKDMALEGAYISPEELAMLYGDEEGAQYAASLTLGKGNGQGGKGSGGHGTGGRRLTTTPDIEDQAAVRRIKKTFMNNYEISPLEDPTIVSDLVEREINGRRGRILVLNSNNPSYTAARLEGDISLKRLVAEEFAHHIAKELHSDQAKYLKCRNDLRFKATNVLLATPDYRQLSE